MTAPIALFDVKSQQALIRPELDRRIAAVLDSGRFINGPAPASARLLPDGSVQAGATYRLQFRSTPLGDDSSALDRFILQPVQDGGKPVAVEVSYGTY